MQISKQMENQSLNKNLPFWRSPTSLGPCPISYLLCTHLCWQSLETPSIGPEGPRKKVNGRAWLRSWALGCKLRTALPPWIWRAKKIRPGKLSPQDTHTTQALLRPFSILGSGREKQKAEGSLEVWLFPTTASAMPFQICVRRGGESSFILVGESVSVSYSWRAYLLVSFWLKYLLESSPAGLLGQEKCSRLESLFCRSKRREVNP